MGETAGCRTRTRVWVEHGQTSLARLVLEEALFGSVVARASQTGEVDQHGDLLSL